MLIIAGHVTVDAADRDRYVSEHQDLVRRARQAPGCLDAPDTAIPLQDVDVMLYLISDVRPPFP
jgi:hypothetical protein